MPAATEMGGAGGMEAALWQATSRPEPKPIGDKMPEGIDPAEFRLNQQHSVEYFGHPALPDPDQLDQFANLKQAISNGNVAEFLQHHDVKFEYKNVNGQTRRVIDITPHNTPETPTEAQPLSPEVATEQNDNESRIQPDETGPALKAADVPEPDLTTDAEDRLLETDQVIKYQTAVETPLVEETTQESGPDAEEMAPPPLPIIEEESTSLEPNQAQSVEGASSSVPEMGWKGGERRSRRRQNEDVTQDDAAAHAVDLPVGERPRAFEWTRLRVDGPDTENPPREGNQHRETEEAKLEAEIRLQSFRESIEAELSAEKKERVNLFGREIGTTKAFREKVGFGLAVTSAVSSLFGFGDVSTVLKYGRQVLGMVNFGVMSSKFAVNREAAKQAPISLQRCEEILDLLRADPESPDKDDLITELRNRIGYQIALHEHGVDLTRYEAKEAGSPTSESFWLRTARAVGTAAKESVTTKEGLKRTGKVLLYSSPFIAAGLATGGVIPLLAAKAAYSGVSGFTSYEAFKRIKEAKEAEPHLKSPLAEKTARFIDEYQEMLGLHKPDETDPDKENKQDRIEAFRHAMLTSADLQRKIIQAKSRQGLALGVGAASAFFLLSDYLHPAQAQAASAEHAQSTNSASPTAEPVAAATAPSATAPAETHHLPPLSTPVESGASPSSEPISIREAVAGSRESADSEIRKLFDAPATGEATKHDFGQEFTENGKHWVVLNIDNNEEKSQAEVLEVVMGKDGQRHVLMPYADISGKDGIPEVMEKYRVSIPVGKDGEISIDNKFGILVDRHNPEKYLALDAHGHEKVVKEPAWAKLFRFQCKRNLMENYSETNAHRYTQWINAEGRLGTAIDRADWTYTVGRSGAMGSIDNDIVPEIQLEWDKNKFALVGHRFGMEFLFNPRELPLSHAEMLAATGNNEALARAAEKTSFIYPDLSPELESIRFPVDTRNVYDHLLEMLKESSSEVATRVDSLTKDPGLKDALIRDIIAHIKNNEIDRYSLMDILGISQPALAEGGEAALGRAYELGTIPAYATSMKNFYRNSPWSLSFSNIEATFNRYGDVIKQGYIRTREDGAKVLSLVLELPESKGGIRKVVKDFLVPGKTFLEW